MEGDAPPLQKEQEDIPEEVSQEKPGRDSGISSEEEVQPYTLLKKEKGTEERDEAESDHIQPLDNSKVTSSIRVMCQCLEKAMTHIGQRGTRME